MPDLRLRQQSTGKWEWDNAKIVVARWETNDSWNARPAPVPVAARFEDGSAECNWSLPFKSVPRAGWPDMRFLNTPTEDDDEDAVTNALADWRNKAPEFPWPTIR